ncbi:tRNA glutamyl-Q(34) synthetase GluQRS [Shewanella intestini]|uniref:Glutamyl-Q tRNA(Asp) synthetase n=1 Tax=Shewanella intestini TaxID=2017544 RepID=A0ABS5I132_9GAMM|nr:MULTISPECIES: tRNA glutamyl-Q(34) synthetase GluQRS [Shewanella]MBR9727725.1 tRNA glutamyl-Q(34) synthetase GluQRS [Shewanella intestini]MRG35125.1 tRNA glutamyl-Q(34) synthetase GluQRS [Shewanella sp. XMDDZSB0408]
MTSYIGRFAPSPSGPLHFGSLIAALASYLRAHSQQGQWIVRMEDLDPPREVAGASDDILTTLDAYGLHWHGSVMYQSQRHQAYQDCIEQLLAQNKGYFCQCTRKQIHACGGTYNGHCKQLTPPLSQGAIRLNNLSAIDQYNDVIMGHVTTEKDFASEDFIIKRRDNLFAYQLAVVLDDATQGVTEVIRGSDLLTSTCRQLSLYNILKLPTPQWGHIPVASIESGFKLSKQNHAPAIDINRPQASIQAALAFLGQPEVDIDHIQVMLTQAIAQFDINKIPKQTEILI